MTKLPKRKITFLFSDIEGSTRLAQQMGEAYVPLLEKHREVIREALHQYQGQEIDTAGDGFFITFGHAAHAVSAAVYIQQTFESKKWAREYGLKIRIGIHFGEALTTSSGYVGLEVHRASRICNAAHGGQVLLSKKAKEQAGAELPKDVTIKDLGAYQVKDFDEAEELFQLVIPNTQQEFPPPRTSSSKPRVAVLPFINLNADPEQEHYCDGISEEIIHALDNIFGLRVVARSSSFAFKGKILDARETGRQLGATAIVEGTVRKRNGQLRISAELVDASSGLNIWSEHYDRKLEDVFELQDEIAHNIAEALKIKLINSKKRETQSRQTDNIEAYDFYLKGRRFFNQFSRKAVGFALQMFQRAIELDDEYALAYCGLSDCYSYLYMYEDTSEKNLREADSASLKAIKLAPRLAEAHASRGVALSLQERFNEAEAFFDKAIELNQHLFEAWYQYGRVCFAQGKLGKAARLFDEASRTRPEDYQSNFLAGQAFNDLGIKVMAEKARRKGIAIAESHLELNPGDTRALYMGANGLVALGEKEKGQEWLRRALTLEPDDPMLLYNAGCIYALLNMQDEALTCLERSVDAGLAQRGWYENDSNLDNIRNVPKFQELLQKMD